MLNYSKGGGVALVPQTRVPFRPENTCRCRLQRYTCIDINIYFSIYLVVKKIESLSFLPPLLPLPGRLVPFMAFLRLQITN